MARRAKFLAGLGIILALLLILVFNFGHELFKPALSEGIIGTYTEKNLPETVTRLLSSGLVNIDSSGKPVGDLAISWKDERDNTVYTFKLKNANWTDGKRLTAADLDLPIPGVEIKALDDNSIQFRLTDTFVPFPNLLKMPVFKKNSLTGTGPYRVVQIKKDQIFVTKLILKSENPNLPNLTIKFYPNEKIAKTALRLGEVQSLLGINELGDLAKDQTLSFLGKTNFGQIVTIFYSTKDAVLSDENLRLTLSFAAPAIKGEVQAHTSIPPGSWAYNTDVKDFLDNPDQEIAFLKKVKNGRDSTITLTATSFLKNVGERVVESWNKQGLKAVLRVESGVPQNFQALLISQNIPQDPDQYSLWHSTQTQTNISKFSNPRVDKDLEDGRKIADQEVRKQKYQDFQKVLLDHAPATFLYFPKYNVVYMKKIEQQLKKVLDLQLSSI